jgi:hypothetical protein
MIVRWRSNGQEKNKVERREEDKGIKVYTRVYVEF